MRVPMSSCHPHAAGQEESMAGRRPGSEVQLRLGGEIYLRRSGRRPRTAARARIAVRKPAWYHRLPVKVEVTLSDGPHHGCSGGRLVRRRPARHHARHEEAIKRARFLPREDPAPAPRHLIVTDTGINSLLSAMDSAAPHPQCASALARSTAGKELEIPCRSRQPFTRRTKRGVLISAARFRSFRV
jgi:hypothetical protein